MGATRGEGDAPEEDDGLEGGNGTEIPPSIKPPHIAIFNNNS